MRSLVRYSYPQCLSPQGIRLDFFFLFRPSPKLAGAMPAPFFQTYAFPSSYRRIGKRMGGSSFTSQNTLRFPLNPNRLWRRDPLLPAPITVVFFPSRGPICFPFCLFWVFFYMSFFSATAKNRTFFPLRLPSLLSSRFDGTPDPFPPPASLFQLGKNKRTPPISGDTTRATHRLSAVLADHPPAFLSLRGAKATFPS